MSGRERKRTVNQFILGPAAAVWLELPLLSPILCGAQANAADLEVRTDRAGLRAPRRDGPRPQSG